MDKINKLKLANVVSMQLMSNNFPITGKTTITIDMENAMYVNVTVKNSNRRKKEVNENGNQSAGL